MSNLHCVSCGADLPAGANFCPQCGERHVAQASSGPGVPTEARGAADEDNDVETVSTVMMSAEDVLSMLNEGSEDASPASDTEDAADEGETSDAGFSVQSGSIMFEPAPDPDGIHTASELPSVEVAEPMTRKTAAAPESSAANTQYDMPILNRTLRGVETPATEPGSADSLAGTHLGVPVPQEVADAARDEAEAYADLHGSEVLDAVMDAPTKAVDVGNLRQSRDQAQSAPTKQVDVDTLRRQRSGERSRKPTGPSHSPLEMPALKLDPEQAAGSGPDTKQSPPRGPDPDSVPTRYEMPALTMDDIERLRAAEAEAEAEASETLEGEDGPDTIATSPESEGVPAGLDQDSEFSETQWFMKGAEVDADLLESVEESEYTRDETIQTGERKKFTLRDLEEDT